MFMLFSILDYFTTVAVHTRLQLSRCQPDTSPTITTTLRTQYYLCRAAWWADEGPVRQLLHAYVSKKSYQSWISKVEQALLCVCVLHSTCIQPGHLWSIQISFHTMCNKRNIFLEYLFCIFFFCTWTIGTISGFVCWSFVMLSFCICVFGWDDNKISFELAVH